jgi:EpsI family protein
MEGSMIARRDLLIGGACLAAAGGAAALKPRREAPLLQGSTKVAALVPATFGDWTSQDIGDPYAVNGEQTLSSKLYNELITRAYRNAKSGVEVLMLLAYGRRQSDELQLHRPEICYPAFGYALVRNEPLTLPVGGQATIPARRLAAEAEGRRENIIYWTRMGEHLPQDARQQRIARLQIAMQGIIPDGILARFSVAGESPDRDWRTIDAFVTELVANIAPESRKVLIGSERADQIKGIARPVSA